MQTIPLAFAVALALSLSACMGTADNARTKSQEMMVGGDADAHGCKMSTGHAWCQATNRCEQPWMLAKQHGFELSQEAFDTFCQNAKP